jgi:diacylglycerol kinase family enzyme
MNDGLMEIMMVKMPKDIIALSDIATSMLSGSFKSNQIETLSAKEAVIEIGNDVHWTLDGEYEEGASVCEIKTIRSAVNIIR